MKWVQVWFIGGPLNNQLLDIPASAVRAGRSLLAEVCDPTNPAGVVEYLKAEPLETGTRAYSCLCEGGVLPCTLFGLRSVICIT
jgi:hypothetical protein